MLTPPPGWTVVEIGTQRERDALLFPTADRSVRVLVVTPTEPITLACSGSHYGDGSPGCPRDTRHHHHDEKCVLPYVDLVIVLGLRDKWVCEGCGAEIVDGAAHGMIVWAADHREACTADRQTFTHIPAPPLHPDWVRAIRDECAAAGVAFAFGGWGEWLPASQVSPFTFEVHDTRPLDCGGKAWRVGHANSGDMLDGKRHPLPEGWSW